MIDPSIEKEPGKLFDFKRELAVFLNDAEMFDGYYNVELSHGVHPDQIAAQVCRRIVYESTKQNTINDDIASLIVPKTSKVSCAIIAPPVIPFVVDEDMPEELAAVVRSDDQSRPPLFDELKCVEISINFENIFTDGTLRKSGEIYRVDLTKDQPIAYKRVPIPVNEQQSRSQISHENQLLTAIANYLEPSPAFTYVEVAISELERVTQTVNQCRKAQQHPQA